MPVRWVAHLDMDAFYASVELLRYPELRGLPVVVGGRQHHHPVRQADGSRRFSSLKDYAGRGVITTATYEARALGVHSGMGLMRAGVLAPDAVLLPADFDEYRRFSCLFKACVAEIAPLIEDRGIDEIYIDLSHVPGAQATRQDDPYAGVRALGHAIKAQVETATGLSCSIGITPNKLLSKLCSDLEKPNGLTILTEGDIPTRIWPLPAKRINGIGPKASARLADLGILTIGDLAGTDVQALISEFGPNYGAWLHHAAHGRDDRPVVTYREPKSLSRETTFERDLHPRQDRAALGQAFTRLCERLAADLKTRQYVAKTIGVKLRYDDFRIVTRDLTLPVHTDDAMTIRHSAGLCLKRVPLDQRLRLLGVRASALSDAASPPVRDRKANNLEPHDHTTLPLFE